MTPEDFNKIVEARLEAIKETLASKGQEYSTDVDKLHNFNVGSKVNNESREQVIWGFATKHLVSVLDIIRDTKEGKYPTNERIDEKIGDLINYLILLESSLKDRNETY